MKNVFPSFTSVFSFTLKKQTSKNVAGTTFNANNSDWTKIFILPHLTICSAYLHSFKYKILQNILFLINKKLSLWNNKKSRMFQMFMATVKQTLAF